MAGTVTIMVKPLQTSSSLEPVDRVLRNLACSILPIIVYTNDDPGLILTYFTARSNFVTWAFL